MKADVAQQRLLVDLASVDAELTCRAPARKPAERQEHGELQAQQRTILDEVGALAIALEDLDEQVAKLDAEVTAVRQREDRDRSLLASGNANAKELTEIQHELDTLERRQSSLEDSELELMERREELQSSRPRRRPRPTRLPRGSRRSNVSNGRWPSIPMPRRIRFGSVVMVWRLPSMGCCWRPMSGSVVREVPERDSCRATSVARAASS